MFLLSVVPFQDRYSLILIQKLYFVFLFVSLQNSQVNALDNNDQSLKYILKVDNYQDYSFDSTQSCENVLINLENKLFSTNPIDYNFNTGVLHSPNYKINNVSTSNSTTKNLNNIKNECNWSIYAPKGYQIQLVLIDYETKEDVKCTEDRLEFRLRPEEVEAEPKKIWINLYQEHNSQNKHLRYEKSNSLSNCDFNLKPFLTINSNSNKLDISYKASSQNYNFLLSFNLIKKPSTLDESTNTCSRKNYEMKCEIELTDSAKSYKHYTCINKYLICNCLSLKPILNDLNNSNKSTSRQFLRSSMDYMDSCDYLIETFDSYLLSLKQQINTVCNYYLNLNTKCRNDQSSFLKWTSLNDEFEDSLDLLTDTTKPLVMPASNSQTQVEPDLNEICTNVIKTNDFGWIASPNFYSLSNKNYDYNLTCSYHIIIQPYQTIQIRFKYFYLNPSIAELGEVNSSKKSKKIAAQNLDYDYLTIYDGPNANSPVLARLTAFNNDFKSYFYSKVFNSKSNFLYIQFHSQISSSKLSKNKSLSNLNQSPLMGFNLTYQIKGYCIENQKQCNSIYEMNCYSPEQTCNDVWDCHNGADERGCDPCKADQYKCKNSIFCYRLEDRCDGDNQCIDKSDELNCDKWTCNSENGTFLCNNGKCVYEQWVCDGTNDCEDGSDELNCPTGLTSRRVITTAVLGGTLCCLLLVMALGCACKLYTLHTATYRNSIRLSQHAQAPTVATMPSSSSLSRPSRRRSSRHRQQQRGSVYTNLSSFMRRLRTDSTNPPTRSDTSATVSLLSNSNSTNTITPSNNSTQTPSTTAPTTTFTNELPLPHHLIAPPTYNQTMGLVDEYEQRQLAFIEHVRTILSQQQQQTGTGANIINLGNGTQMSSMSIIPTVTSSSTTVHRVTSSSRRAHGSSRNHRHSHHGSSSSNSANTDSSGHHRHRSNRHRHRHHTNASSQLSFDLNRRGLQFETTNSNSNSVETESEQTQQSNLVTIPEFLGSNPSTSSQTNTTGSNANASSANSVNLRDRIAKLIKDIVVHHGDNIQYVQLADQMNANGRGVQANASLNQDETSSIESILSNQEQLGNQITLREQTSRMSNANEDDEPLIQP